MKLFARTAVASALLISATHAFAYDVGAGFDISANLGIASNYLWRGISQTSDEAALQGGFDISHSTGFYAGTWVSNVKFGAAPDAKSEQDAYIGYAFSKAGFSVDVSYVKYIYARENTLNFGETHLELGYSHDKAGSFAIGADYSDKVPGVGNTLHYYLSYARDLPEEVGLGAMVGEYDFKDKGALGGQKSKYSYYGVSVSKSLYGLDTSLSYTNTSMDDNHCKAFTSETGNCGSTLTLSVSKTFQ